jgi:hypothetical protein
MAKGHDPRRHSAGRPLGSLNNLMGADLQADKVIERAALREEIGWEVVHERRGTAENS